MKKRTNNDNNRDASNPPANSLPSDFDPDVPTREQVLDTLRKAGKPLSPEALADATHATIPLSTGFIRRIKAMERDGQVRYNPQGRLQICNNTHFITGVVQGHRDGFGFLIPDEGGQDLFLSPNDVWTAAIIPSESSTVSSMCRNSRWLPAMITRLRTSQYPE